MGSCFWKLFAITLPTRDFAFDLHSQSSMSKVYWPQMETFILQGLALTFITFDYGVYVRSNDLYTLCS